MNGNETAAAKLRTAFDLYTAGVRMKRQSLRRRHPDTPAEEIEAMVEQWLHERPGAEHGDADGRLAEWPRKNSQVT